MRKLIFSLVTMLTVFIGAINAQDVKETVMPSKVVDNLYLSLGGGVMTNLDFNGVFPLNGFATVKVGENITPIFGMNVEGTASFGSAVACGLRWDGVSHNTVRATYVGINPTINLTNWFGDHSINRRFNLLTETGIGWYHTFVPNNADNNDFGSKTGLIADVKLGKTRAWSIFANPSVYWNMTSANNGVKFNKKGAQLSVMVGVTYNFLNSNKAHGFVPSVAMTPSYYNSLVNDLRKAQESSKEEANTVIKTVEVEKVVNKDRTAFVSFAQGSSELTDAAKAKLNNIPTGTHVTVTGTTSPEGSTRFNNQLGKNRANVITSYLTERGVIVDSIYYGENGRLGIVVVSE